MHYKSYANNKNENVIDFQMIFLPIIDYKWFSKLKNLIGDKILYYFIEKGIHLITNK